jgi:hypothetical protein
MHKVEKINIELTDSSDESVKVKVEFTPELPEGEELEMCPSLVALNMMLEALADIGEEVEEGDYYEERKLVH